MTKKVFRLKSLPVKPGQFTLSRKSTISMSSAELQSQIDRVRAYAMANVGTITHQVEALKRSLPSDLPTVLAGPVEGHRRRS
jgi:hypothetical protein